MRSPRVVLPFALLILGPFASTAHARVQKMMWYEGGRSVAQQLDQSERLHVDVIQVAINWSSVAATRPADPTNPADTAYRWPAQIDDFIAQAKRRGMSAAVMLTRAPGWANGGRSSAWSPTKPQDYADFATAAARHYAGVHLWMIWGEPPGKGNFRPLNTQRSFKVDTLNSAEKRGPHAYARLVDAAYAALKRQSPRNLVVGGMSFVTGDIRAINWVKNLRLPNGRPPRMDLYGHNPFSAREPDLSNRPSPQQAVDFSDLGRLQRVVNRSLAAPRHKRRIRLFLSEFSIPTGLDSEFNFHTTRGVQARWIHSAFRVARTLDAYGLGWIHLYDHAGLMGGLLDENGQPKPGFTAFRNG